MRKINLFAHLKTAAGRFRKVLVLFASQQQAQVLDCANMFNDNAIRTVSNSDLLYTIDDPASKLQRDLQLFATTLNDNVYTDEILKNDWENYRRQNLTHKTY